jgi:PAS domain S-box-containing protein
MHWNVVLLNFVPACINAGLLLYTLFALPWNRTNNIFALFIFLLGAEQFSDGMMHTATSLEAAALWQHIAMTPWIFITPIGVLFVLSLTQGHTRNEGSWHQSALLIPALVCQIMHSAGLDLHIMVYDETWGWIGNPGSNAATLFILFYITGTGLLMPMLLIHAYRKHRKTAVYRNKFLLLAIGVAAPYVGGVLGEVILPVTFRVNEIPLASPLMTVFSVCALISISRHKLLDFSPIQQFDRILETMTEGVLIADNSGRIMYANPSVSVILQYDVNALTGKAVDIFLKDSRFTSIPELRGNQEVIVQRRDGENIWVRISASPCLDGKGKEIGTTLVITDVDQLKKNAAVISRNEAILSRAQEVAHVGSWQLSFATGKAAWSEEACRIYGLEYGRDLTFGDWAACIHPADLASVMLQVKTAQETNSDTDIEHRIVQKDGTIKYIHFISKVEFDHENNPVGMFCICQDITAMRFAEGKLRSTSKELETYIYKSSHDMHAPLATILGLINVSRLEVYEPTAVKFLGMIEQQAKKLDSVRVEFIKAMHIKDATQLNQEVHVNAMIGEILRDLRMREGFSGVNINVNVNPEQTLISNEFLVRTILQNLIDNSIKYRDTTREQPQVLIDLELRGKTTCITVEDNGIGIDPSLHEKIFDMYFKTEESRTGSGLGLYLVKKAVEKLDATMSLRSSPGQGTRFTLSFVQAN